VLSCRCYL